MDRKEFIRRLTLAEAEGIITPEESEDLLRRFDAGEITADMLPSSLGDLLDLVALLGVLNIAASLLSLDFLSRIGVIGERIRLWESSLPPAGGGIRQWTRRMGEAVRQNLLELAELGAGRALTSAELRRLREALLTEYAHLDRFADQIAFRALLGRPMSKRQIRDRMRQYAGSGIGFFYTFLEEQLGDGYVIDYVSNDDGGTCTPCLTADLNSPYLPTQGPMPGVVCVAHGKCRCERTPRFDPIAAQALGANIRAGRFTSNPGRDD